MSTQPPIAVLCAWCKELRILKLDRKPTDVVVVVMYGKTVKISLNGDDLQLSHTYCPECQAKELASMKEESSQRSEPCLEAQS